MSQFCPFHAKSSDREHGLDLVDILQMVDLQFGADQHAVDLAAVGEDRTWDFQEAGGDATQDGGGGGRREGSPDVDVCCPQSRWAVQSDDSDAAGSVSEQLEQLVGSPGYGMDDHCEEKMDDGEDRGSRKKSDQTATVTTLSVLGQTGSWKQVVMNPKSRSLASIALSWARR